MKYPQLYNTRFTAMPITLLTAFILSSCSPVEQAFDKTINSSISDITDDSEIAVTPVMPIEPLEKSAPVIPVDINAPVDSIVVNDPAPPIKPTAPIEPIVVIDPFPPVEPVAPIDPVVVIKPLPPVDPVPPAQTNQAQLSWVAPAEREDASPLLLSEIAGYKIYYGSKQGSYSNTININDSTAMSYVFTMLATGTYYVVLTTYDMDGRESQYSSEVMVNV